MHWIAFCELSVHDGHRLDLCYIEWINLIDQNRSWREVIVIIERAKEVTFEVVFYLFCVFCLLSSIYASGKDRLHYESSKAH